MKDRFGNKIGAEDFDSINWKQVKEQVRKLKGRIFKATQSAKRGTGSWNKVRSLMKLLLCSRTTLILAILKVTHINKGKGTAGVDGITITTNSQRTRLINDTRWKERVLPTRRIHIPKSNGKKRPLGIPTVYDRIGQAIMLSAYEPVFEAGFESNSFGFRPGRCVHDAVQTLFNRLIGGVGDRYVLDADIHGAFDNISHEFLLHKIKGFPGRDKIEEWLKAGFIEFNKFNATEAGTPQGGILSPLLANIALDGLQEFLEESKVEQPCHTVSRGKPRTTYKYVNKFTFCRYADDFVVQSKKKEWLEEVKPHIQEWLQERGLKLNSEKTSIRDIRTDGLNFLGYNFSQFTSNHLREGSKEHKRLLQGGKRKGDKFKKGKDKPKIRDSKPRTIKKGVERYSCIITPQKEKVKSFLQDIKQTVKKACSWTFEELIRVLNVKLRGWANYYKFVCSKDTFNTIRHEIFQIIWRFLKRRHPLKGEKWIYNQYCTKVDGDKYVFFANYKTRKNNTAKILMVNIAKDIPITRHIKIKGNASPLDPELRKYWEERNRKCGKQYFSKGSKFQKLFDVQRGICPICGESIYGEPYEVHHIIPIKDGGTNKEDNLVIIHKQCHKIKHKELHYDLINNSIDPTVSKKVKAKKVSAKGL